jgi:short subunit fatty acids transporter
MDFSYDNYNNFLHNMFRLVIGHLLLPTTLTISTHMNHVHIVSIIIIMLVIV